MSSGLKLKDGHISCSITFHFHNRVNHSHVISRRLNLVLLNTIILQQGHSVTMGKTQEQPVTPLCHRYPFSAEEINLSTSARVQ